MVKNFALCCDSNYVPFACVTMKSIYESMNPDDEIRIHVLGNNLTEKDHEVLRSIGPGISVYEVAEEMEKQGLGVTSEWSIATWSRLCIPDIVDEKIERVLYLDCDVIVNDALDGLFEMVMDGKSIAGCIDTQDYDNETFSRLGYNRNNRYICAGVLMMNLAYWRKQDLKNKILEYGKGRKLKFLDQDAINYVCHDSKIILAPDYGILVPYFFHEEFVRDHHGDLRRIFYAPKIIHYAGYQPWNYAKNKSAHSDLWWKYYNTLGMFPGVKKEYSKSMIKYFVRWILSKTGIIGKNSKYSIYQYYYHPVISKRFLLKQGLLKNGE